MDLQRKSFGSLIVSEFEPQCTSDTALSGSTKYDLKLVHIPSNAMLLDTVVEAR